MPTLTNKYGFPPATVVMAQSMLRRPEPETIHVTELIAPPAIRQLSMEHWDNLVLDVYDFLHAGFGTAWHKYMAEFAGKVPNATLYSEQTMSVNIDGVVLTGTMDLMSDSGVIDDYKVTSVWSFIFGRPDWREQLNTYAHLCHLNGIAITKLYISAFLRDWHIWESLRNRDYPRAPFHRLQIPVWSMEKQHEFIANRMALHLQPHTECSPDDKWQQNSTYAVMKQGIKTARRVLNSYEEAEQWLNQQKKDKDKLSIMKREGSCRRCEQYCTVRSVCPYCTRGTDDGTHA